MRKSILRSSAAYVIVLLMALQSCKDDSNLTESLPLPDQSFSESFDVYQEAYNKGWRALNKSFPIGRKWMEVAEVPVITSANWMASYYPEWNQAQFTIDSLQYQNIAFPGRYWENAYQSQRASNGYVAASLASAELFNLNAPADYEVNNWLVSPEVTIKNGDKISFYTYCKGVARLQLWVNQTTSLNVGTDVNNTGDFKLKLVDINTGYADVSANPIKAYPQYWTRFEGEVTGLAAPVKGRFGFRYLIQDGAASIATTEDELFNEIHQSVIGIDAVTYTSSR